MLYIKASERRNKVNRGESHSMAGRAVQSTSAPLDLNLSLISPFLFLVDFGFSIPGRQDSLEPKYILLGLGSVIIYRSSPLGNPQALLHQFKRPKHKVKQLSTGNRRYCHKVISDE